MTESKPLQFSSSARAYVRDLVEACAEGAAGAKTLEVELYALLRPFLPDPGAGAVQFAAAMVPTALKILIPSPLYERLCQHGVELWMHRIAAEHVPEKEKIP